MPSQKRRIPDRWLNYCPVGRRIPGTRFIAFKVPFKESLNCQLPKSDSFSLWDLLDSVESQNQELGLIIDLTFTTKYYELTDVPQSCFYTKILTQGHRVPSNATILSFKQAVRRFLKENQDNDKLIGVHCTHGLNRTGYLVCRYLIDVDGFDPLTALELFNSCRGHCIERKNYLRDLQSAAKRSNDAIDHPQQAAARGLAVERPPQTTRQDQRPPQTTRQDQRPPQATRPDQRPPQTTRQDQRLPQTTRQDQRPPQTTRPDQRPPQTTRQDQRLHQTTREEGQLFQNITTAAAEQDGHGSVSDHQEAAPSFSDDPAQSERPAGNRRRRRARRHTSQVLCNTSSPHHLTPKPHLQVTETAALIIDR